MQKYVMTSEGVFRVLDDGTYEPVPKPKPMKAGVILSPEEIEVRRGYWGARRRRFPGPTDLWNRAAV